MKIIAKTFAGLEVVLAKEIENIGGQQIEPLKRAVKYEGNQELLYQSNYLLRSALRILVPFLEFEINQPKDLFQNAYHFNWNTFLNPSMTFAIDAAVNSDFYRHSNYPALMLKDAIADRIRKEKGIRPSVDTQNPDVKINLHIFKNKVTLSLDSSGNSLHKRGYRNLTVAAPINEVLAAGMILISGWDGSMPFLDPMCGSGTLVIEAASIALNRPPLYLRPSFGFMQWKDFDAGLWDQILKENNGKIKSTSNFDIIGRDINNKGVSAAGKNCLAAELYRNIIIEKGDFFKMPKIADQGLIITNPPYDERMELTDTIGYYKKLGDTLKQQYTGWSAWIISSNPEGLKNLGLKPSAKKTLFNGPLECKFQRFDMYAGSKKTKPNQKDF